MELKYLNEQQVNAMLDMQTCIGLMKDVFNAFAAGKMENKLASPPLSHHIERFSSSIPSALTASIKL